MHPVPVGLEDQPSTSSAMAAPAVTLPLVAAIERSWSAIRSEHGDVPAVVVTLGAGSMGTRGELRYGHFAAARWQVDRHRVSELFVGGEGLERGPEAVLSTLLHEAAHGIANTRSIQDTSRQGRYHNKRFAALADEVGLGVTRHVSLGWSPSALAPGTADRYPESLASIASALVAFRHPEMPGGRGKNKTAGNGVAAVCNCEPVRRIRVRSADMFEAGPIICGVCKTHFEVVDPGNRPTVPGEHETASGAAAELAR